MSRGRAGAWLLALCLALGTASAQTGLPVESPFNLLDRLEATWRARDVDGYLGLWAFENDAARQDEPAPEQEGAAPTTSTT